MLSKPYAHSLKPTPPSSIQVYLLARVLPFFRALLIVYFVLIFFLLLDFVSVLLLLEIHWSFNLEGWWELVFWTMLLRACTMQRRGENDRSWSGRLLKSSSSFFWLCRSTVCFFDLTSSLQFLFSTSSHLIFCFLMFRLYWWIWVCRWS